MWFVCLGLLFFSEICVGYSWVSRKYSIYSKLYFYWQTVVHSVPLCSYFFEVPVNEQPFSSDFACLPFSLSGFLRLAKALWILVMFLRNQILILLILSIDFSLQFIYFHSTLSSFYSFSNFSSGSARSLQLFLPFKYRHFKL